MTKHTPVPWNEGYTDAWGVTHIGTINEHVFQANEANAAFIVKACNNHDALVEALKFQEMADADPEAARRKGYYDTARKMRKKILEKLKLYDEN